MLERLTAFFGNPASYTTALPEADAAHAMGALLVRAAKADDAYLFEEIAIIDRILARRHDLNPVEACLLYTSPSPRDQRGSRMPSSA